MKNKIKNLYALINALRIDCMLDRRIDEKFEILLNDLEEKITEFYENEKPRGQK
jgi:hypothetical protein